MADIPDLALGILGVLLGLLPIAFLIHKHVPLAYLHQFDELVDETEAFLTSHEEKGTFSDSSTVTHYRTSLRKVQSGSETLRLKTYCARSVCGQLHGLLCGLSWQLRVQCRKVLDLRAEISTTATEEINKRQSENETSSEVSQEATQDRADANASTTPSDDVVLVDRSPTGSSPSKLNSVDAGEVSRTPANPEPIHARLERPLRNCGSEKPKMRLNSDVVYMRRLKRYQSFRPCSLPSVTKLEHRKSGLILSEDYRRILRAHTQDTLMSTDSAPTSVSGVSCSSPDTLPLYTKHDGRTHRKLIPRWVKNTFRIPFR